VDVIRIRDLQVESRIGVTEEERATPQPLTIDISIEADLRTAGASDDLADTIDYGRVTTEIAALARESELNLLEALAERIAARIATTPRVERVTVEVAKPFPPIDEDVGPVSVRVMRP
jgi:dihydroneopterin aldolase